MVNYVQRYRAHLEGLLSYMNTLRTGSCGIDRSRVYPLNGDNYYDKAVICHPARLARQTKRFRSGPPQPYFPFASTREEVSAMQGKRGRSIRIPYKGDSYFMGYDYDKKKKRYLRSAMGSARAGKWHSSVDRQCARDQGQAALRQDLPR